MQLYKAFGLNIKSEFPLRTVLAIEEGIFDVEFKKQRLPKTLSNPSFKGVRIQANSHQFLIDIPSIGIFLIEDGKRVFLSPEKGVEYKEIELFFLGSIMAVILTQRNILPFHGAAFEKDGSCVIISGSSGAGKSTLLRHFINLGFKAVSDDVSAIKLIDGKPFVIPSFPSSKIWINVMQAYQLTYTKEDRLRPDIEKYSYSFKDQFTNKILPLDSIYILNSHNLKTFSNEEFKGFDKLKKIKDNIYRPRYPKIIQKEKETFAIMNAIANYTRVFQITRSNSLKLLESFNKYAEQTIIQGEYV